MIAALTLMAACMHAPATFPVDVRLGAEGDIDAWLIAGPYPNDGALQMRGTGFRTNHLGDEAAFAMPHEGKAQPWQGKEVRWRLALSRGRSGLDLREEFENAFPAIGYAAVTLVSDRDQDGVLRWGSDDGARLYVNGELLWEKQLPRGVTRDEETTPIRLRRGENLLLYKIEQGDGGWGLVARLTGPDGARIEGVRARLNVVPGEPGDSPESAVRAGAGKPGSVDAEVVRKLGDWRAKAALWVDRFRDQAEEPERLDQALEAASAAAQQAKTATPDAAAELRRQALANLRSAYDRARHPLLIAAQHPAPLSRVDVGKERFVRVMPGGRQFESGGEPFVPIGYNHNPDWPRLMASNPLVPESGNFDAKAYDPSVTDAWFEHLAQHGVNLVRLMVETPPSGNLEDPVGTFQPEAMVWLDNIVSAARKHGVRLMVTPYDTFWMNLRWDTTTYAPANGGPVRQKIDWYTNEAVIELQRERMRWLIDRYGNLDTIFCWEIMNEADLWWGATPAQIGAWADDMVRFVRQYSERKWGVVPMVTFSSAEAMPQGELADLLFRRPDLDFATTHLYIGASKAPNQPTDVIPTMEQGVRHALAQIRDARPYLDGENGPIDRWIADEATDDKVFHHQSWAHLAAGGAGSSLRWPYRNPHHLTPGMLGHLKRMRTFVDAVDWRAFTGDVRPLQVTFGEGLVGTSFATARGALVFAARTGGEGEKIVRVEGLPPGRVRAYDTQAGRWLDSGYLLPAGVESVCWVVDGS